MIIDALMGLANYPKTALCLCVLTLGAILIHPHNTEDKKMQAMPNKERRITTIMKWLWERPE